MAARKKKIAVVIPKYGLVGGAEVYAAELTERLAQMDRYEFHVFANKWVRHSDKIFFHKVPVISFPRFLTTPSFAYFACSKVSNMNFDLIHAHDRIFNADIFTMHGIPHRAWTREVRKKTMSPFDYATEWVEKSLVSNSSCRRFLAVSSLSREVFIKAYPSASDLIGIMSPGIGMEKYKSLERNACRKQIRDKCGIGFSDTLLLFVSMNFELKGLEQLIRAVALVNSKNSAANLRLLVVGKGDQRKYENLAGTLGISDRVIFFGVCRKDIESVYLASDIFALLSSFDTFGMAVLEAMAASLPVIISSRVGARDLVKERINGFVLDKYTDVEEISRKILDIISSPELREGMARAAYVTAAVNTWEKVAERADVLYEELLTSRENDPCSAAMTCR